MRVTASLGVTQSRFSAELALEPFSKGAPQLPQLSRRTAKAVLCSEIFSQAETRAGLVDWSGVSDPSKPLKTSEEVREELAELIREAVRESDDGRRRGLLTLADHWSDILRRRQSDV